VDLKSTTAVCGTLRLFIHYDRIYNSDNTDVVIAPISC
jgi:hypothetical protein